MLKYGCMKNAPRRSNTLSQKREGAVGVSAFDKRVKVASVYSERTDFPIRLRRISALKSNEEYASCVFESGGTALIRPEVTFCRFGAFILKL